MKPKTLVYLVLITLFTFLTTAAHAQTFSVLHYFTGGLDSSRPEAGVTIRGDALYGVTGGDSGGCDGTVYQLTHSGSNWLFSTLAALPNERCLQGRVVFGPDSHLYGTSALGGTHHRGTVFRLTPQIGPCRDAACYWTANDLHDFGSGTDAANPLSGDLIWDQQGNIYGTTASGGTSPNCRSGCGAVYELTPSGNGYTESVLYSFSDAPDGKYPYAGVVLDNKGNLFGTTYQGGSNNCISGCGTVFELAYVPGVGWTEQVLHSFQNASDGMYPSGGLVVDSSGNLYGTTSYGGSGGGGTVFELSPVGDTWTFKLLHSFSSGGYACGPTASLSMDGAGNLYGTTFCSGIYNGGSVFKLSNTENGWMYTSLHEFNFHGNDGAFPVGNVSIDTDGTLYGTTWGAGQRKWCGGQGCGVVWMIKP